MLENVEGTITLVLGGYPDSNPNAQWNLTCWDDGAISLLNLGLKQFLVYTGDDQPVATASGMCIQALWTVVQVQNGWWAIRPALNVDMNLNAFGGATIGGTVGVLSWGGGNDNEIWGIHFLDGSNWGGCANG